MIPTLKQARTDIETLRLSLPDTRINALLAFAELLQKWNRHFNLLSRRDMGRVWSRHILDSLSVVPFLRGRRILDLGSGGGFPGLPLAIAEPEREFLLVDRHQRKCRFLEQAAASLELANVRVHCGDVAELVPAPGIGSSCAVESGCFDTVTSRAVAPPAAVWALIRPLLAAGHHNGTDPGGRLVVLASTQTGAAQLPQGARCERLSIPGLEPDHEVVIIDVSTTDG